MKKETWLTAVIFLGAGFLAGFAFNAHQNSLHRREPVGRAAIVASAEASQPNPTLAPGVPDGGLMAGEQLPKGHPAINDAQIIQFFKNASSRNPNDPAPRLKLADFLYDRQRFSDAVPWYQQALALDPQDVDARTDMATCLFNMGRTREAVDELQQALTMDPHHEATLFNLAVVNLDGTHDLRAANDALKRLRAINPGYPGLDQLQQAVQAAGAKSLTRTAAP